MSSLLIYFLSFFKVPAGIISSIKSIFKRIIYLFIYLFFFGGVGGGEVSKKIS